MEKNKPNKYEMVAWIKEFTKWPHRMTGTPEGIASAELTADIFRQVGLDNVAIEPVSSVCYETEECTLEVNGKNLECHLANGTNRKGKIGRNECRIEAAQVVYLKTGTAEDFNGVDVEGKIVVCDCKFKPHKSKSYMAFFDDAKAYDPEGKLDNEPNIYNIFSPNDWPFNYIRAKEKGAVAFIGILHNFMDCHYYHEDYTEIMDIPIDMDIPGIWVSKKDGEELKKMLDDKITATLRVITEYMYKDALNVVGIVKGQSEDVLVIHSHHDATCKGAVQDASGMAIVFSLAKYFASLPKEKIKTTIMFLSTDSHYTDYEGHVGFIEQRAKEGKKIIMDFAVEHIGKAMELDSNNEIILYDETEVRQIYVSKVNNLPEIVYGLVEKYDLEKMMLLPVEHRKEGEYQSGDVNSDAYDFHVRGIPVVSLIAAPMYLYHNSDNVDKVHQDSLEPVSMLFLELVFKVWNLMEY